MPVTCPNCRADVPDGEVTCPECGHRLSSTDVSLGSLGTEPARGAVDESLGDLRTAPGRGAVEEGAAAVAPPLAQVEERYEILEEIGRGGMGRVCRARDMRLNRFVAVKRLLAEEETERQAVQRFLNEAQAIAALSHRSIVHVYDVGRDQNGVYIVMEFVEGRSLNKVIADARTLDFRSTTPADFVASVAAGTAAGLHLEEPESARKRRKQADRVSGGRISNLDRRYFRTTARMVADVAEALEYAHGQGVVHRDIKPHNLMLTAEGRLVITDFGLARLVDRPRLTMSAEMMGTPAYMSPEQVAAGGIEVDHRTDIYSLGVTLYELLTFRLPFEADRWQAVLRQILVKDPPAPRRLDQHIPRDLETICLKAMEKDRDRRYQRAAVLAGDLRAFLDGLPISARPVGPVGRLYRRARRSKALTAALAAACLGLVVSAYFGAQAYRAHRRILWARRSAEIERRAADQFKAENRRLLIDAGLAALDLGEYPVARERLTGAAKTKWDDALHFCFWRLARHFQTEPRMILRGHQSPVTYVAFSPDGKTLLSGSSDKTVRVWDVATGRQLRTLSEEVRSVGAVAFSPNGKAVAADTSAGVKIWDATTGQEIRTLGQRGEPVQSLAFSPDGRLLALKAKDIIRLHEVATGAERRTFKAARTSGRIVFSPDGRLLAAVEGSRIELWDVVQGHEWRSLTGQTNLCHWVAFSPDGTLLLSGSYDGIGTLWDVTTGEQLRTLEGHMSGLSSVAYSPTGDAAASGCRAGEVRLWDVPSGRERALLLAREQGITSLAFSQDGKLLASGARSGAITLWDATVGHDRRTLTGHQGDARSVVYSPDGQVLASGDSRGEITLWEAATGRILRRLAGHEYSTRAIAFSPDGKIVASGAPQEVRRWEVATGKSLPSLALPADRMRSVAFSADGRILAAADGTAVTVWDTATGRTLRTFGGGGIYCRTVAFSPDGQVLASGSHERTVKVWDVSTGSVILTLRPLEGSPYVTTFDPNARWLAISSRDYAIRVWDIANRKHVQTLTGHRRWVETVAFSQDGDLVASAAPDGTLRVWGVGTGRLLGLFRPGARVQSIAFRPDGREFAHGVGTQIHIYDLAAYDDVIQQWLGWK